MARIVIIGAGITGLSIAHELEKNGITDYMLLEQENVPGGLCRSVTRDGFTFDYTGHLLHGPHEKLQALIPPMPLVQHNRNAWVYARKRWIPYPFQRHIAQLPATIAADCIEQFIARPHIDNPTSFYDWALTHFGAGIAREFFWPFQRKVYARNLHRLTPGWAARQAPRVTLADLKTGSKAHSCGSNATFLYPASGGIQTLVNALVAPLRTPINLNCHVTRIDMARKIVYCANGSSWPYDMLVNTSSLRQFLSHIKDSSTTNFAPAHKKLLSSTVININLGLNANGIQDRHWVYVPGKTYPFYRFGMPHMLAPDIAPAGNKSVSIEYAHASNRAMDKDAVARHCQEALCKLLRIAPEHVATQIVLDLPDAYAVYDTWHATHLQTLLAGLKQHNIWSVGRFGAWSYGSMLDALDEGRITAQRLRAQY